MIHWLNELIEECGKLGNLPSATIWALTTLVLGYYVWVSKKQEREAQAVWQQIRIDDAKAEMAMSMAIKDMVNLLRDHSDQIHEMRVIVDERLPHRS